VEFPIDTTASGLVMPASGGSAVRKWTIALSVAYSLILAAGAGCVFYASIRPVSISTGYFSFLDGWSAAYLLLGAAWVVGPVILLILGLIGLSRHVRLTWWFAVGWLSAVAGGTAIGLRIMHGFGLLFTAYPYDGDGSPLGPSRWAPGTPYWQALVAMGGQLAVGAAMIALIAALSRNDASTILGQGQARG